MQWWFFHIWGQTEMFSGFHKLSFKIYFTMSADKLDTRLKILEAQIKKDQTNYCDLADLEQQLAAWQAGACSHTRTHTDTATQHVASGKHNLFLFFSYSWSSFVNTEFTSCEIFGGHSRKYSCSKHATVRVERAQKTVHIPIRHTLYIQI